MWSRYAHVPVTVILPLYDRAAMEIQQWNVSGSYIFICCQTRGKLIVTKGHALYRIRKAYILAKNSDLERTYSAVLLG